MKSRTFRSARRADFVGAGALVVCALALAAGELWGYNTDAWYWVGVVAFVVLAIDTARGCRIEVGAATIRIRSYTFPTKAFQRERLGSITKKRNGLYFIDASGRRLAWCAGVWDADTVDSLRSVALPP